MQSIPPSGISLLIILGLGAVFAGLFIFLAYAFGPKKPTASKLSVYECGVPVKSGARPRFSIKFYIIAIIFLLFDVEVVFLFPWAVLLKSFKAAGQGWEFFAPMGLFLLILGLGLFYEYKSGALEWES